ncbi:MAG: DUF4326 domain-containing protein [Verrucomicrobiota bacterium]
MQRHKYNIFPEANPENFEHLKEDIRLNGFDPKYPIIVCDGGILDGWNRHRACLELGVEGVYETFSGTDTELIALVMRTNKRRHLSSGQWATIAVEAESIMSAIAQKEEKGRVEKLSVQVDTTEPETSLPAPVVAKKDPKAAAKIAEVFNTNQSYVNQAAKIKVAAPEVFEQLKAGTITMQDASKVVRAKPTNPWSDDEKERQALAQKGTPVVANTNRDKNLILWATEESRLVKIDRASKYWNPFILGEDGTREEVCDHFETRYLPLKPSLLDGIKTLEGKVLVCQCYPERCHGDALVTAYLNAVKESV